MNDLIQAIDRLIEEKHLLKHPFYQAWTKGELTLDALKEYSKQYYKQVKTFPTYLGWIYAKTEDLTLRRKVLENLIEEDWGEENHPELWMRFAEGLGVDRKDVEEAEALPETAKSVEMIHDITAKQSAAAGMAAIYAYESMVPEVSETKIDGLKKFYGIDDERTLKFFVVHEEADRVHREWDKELLKRMVKDEADAEACKQAAQTAVDALWTLLDGVQANYVTAAA